MRLRDLDAWFIGQITERTHHEMESLAGSQGVMFQCPRCGEGLERGEEIDHWGVRRGFIRGAHYIRVCFANPREAPVAPVEFDKNPRWQMEGTSLDDLTLSPSINCDVPWKDKEGIEHPSSCKFHGFVKNGDAA